MDPLHRVGAVQRLVEHEDPRIDHQGGGDLAALPHPLAEGVDAAIGDVEQADGAEGVVRCAAVRHPVEVGDVRDELSGAEPRRHGLVLGHERHPRVHTAVTTRVTAFDAHGSLVDADEAGDRPHQSRLAGAVGPEQAGDARAEGAAQLRQGDLRPEPHRHLGHLDRGIRRERGVGEAHGSCRIAGGGESHRSTQR